MPAGMVDKLKEYHQNYLKDRSNLLLRRFYINVANGRLYNTKYLLDHAQLNLKGFQGRFAIHLVVKIPEAKNRAKLLIFRWLLAAGCEFNIVDEKGMNVLMSLLKDREIALSKILIQNHRMDIKYTQKDLDGNDSLMYGIRTDNVEIVTLLVEIYQQFGLDLDLRNKQGYTPYAEAVRLKAVGIAQTLKNSGRVSLTVIPYESIPEVAPPISQMRVNIARSREENLRKSASLTKTSQKKIKKQGITSPNQLRCSMDGGEDPPKPQQNSNLLLCNATTDVAVGTSDAGVDDESDRSDRSDTANGKVSTEDGGGEDIELGHKVSFLKNLVSTVAPVDSTNGRESRMGQVPGLRRRVRSSPSSPLTIISSPVTSQASTNITYKHIREMYPEMRGLGTNLPSIEDLKWMLALQADQQTDTHRHQIPEAQTDRQTDRDTVRRPILRHKGTSMKISPTFVS